MDDIAKTLSDLVSIPSVNPSGQPPTAPGHGEGGVARYVEDFLRRIGADCRRQPVLPSRANVIGFVSGRGADTLVLEAHMDTVPGENMEIEPFKPVVKDGRLYGRGACDTKASLTAMLTALRNVLRRGKPACSVVFAATVDEEHKFTGVKELLESGMRATFGVVGEPTNLDVVIAHKGVVRWEIRTRGKTAHSSRPNEGVNAIYRMARLISAVERYAAGGISRLHPLVGGATLSVGTILGGQAINVVPDSCSIQLDRRTLPGEDPFEAKKAVGQFLRSCPEINFEFEECEPFLVDWAMEVKPDEPIVQRLTAACQRVLGQAKSVGVSYGTDASKLTRAGIPSIVFGPGDIRQAHSAVEFVELAQVGKAVAVFEALLESGNG